MKIFLLLCLFFSPRLDIFAQWEWQNPKPQGSDILSSYFINESNGWAVGNNGACIRTRDGGESWEDISLPVYNNLCSVRFINQDTGYIGDWDGDIIKTTDGGTSWSVQHLDDYADIHIFFIDQNYGWILSSGFPTATYKLYRTTNGGINWQSNLINTTYIMNDLYFIDSSKGFVIGGFGSIMMTTDGGINWNYVNSPVANAFYKIIFKNNLEGFIGGSDGTLLKTFDGGINWQYNTVGPYTIWDISFLNNNLGILVESGSKIFTTSDGGDTWIDKTFSSVWSLRTCKYLNTSDCLVLGELGNIYKSYNNANNWTYKVMGSRSNLNDIKFIGNGKGYAIGDEGTLLKTTNYGQVWDNLDITTNKSLKSIYFSDDQHGYIVGTNSLFLKTEDGGESWIIDSIQNSNNLTTVFFLNNNLGWVAGDNSKILKTTDGGDSWIPQNVNITANLRINSLAIADENTGYACGNYSSYYPPKSFVLKTTDGGNNWNEIKTQTPSEFESIFFTNAENGWVVDHTLPNTIHTINGGNDWDTLGIIGNEIYFWNNLYGIILNYHSVGSDVYLTSDGGNSWISKPNITDRYLYSAYIDFNGVWTVGMFGTILYHDFSILPVELTNFTGSFQNGKVFLNWTTASELNNQRFEIERKIISNNSESEWTLIGYKPGRGTSTEQNEYAFTDDIGNLNVEITKYRLKQIDYNGSYIYSQVIEIHTSPLSYSLSQNYPNPFNPITKINYQITELSNVKLSVYDVLGREVRTLVNEGKLAGSYEVEFNGTDLPSGVYFYRIEAIPNGRQAGKYSNTKKFVLLK